jgi:hypothetical protein
VDTVVTRCRGRATDEKHVATEIYDAGDVWQHGGDAKWTYGNERGPRLRKCSQACHGRKLGDEG